MPRLLPMLILSACGPGGDDPVDLDPGTTPVAPLDFVPVTITATDEATASNFLDLWFGDFLKGRAMLPADFDGDGRTDVFAGNPGTRSLLIMNRSEDGVLWFEPGQVLSEGEVFWGGVAEDFDNDGLSDLFVATGGNETSSRDVLYLNTGDLDEPLQIRDNLATPPGGDLPTATGSAVSFDFDNDGDLDVFAPNGIKNTLILADLQGPNRLWRNDGDGSFVDVAFEVGLDSEYDSRLAAVLDFDNDGDLDLFENNYSGPSILWRNELTETGEATFVDVTTHATLDDSDLRAPLNRRSWGAIAADYNQDGWDDLLVFRRKDKDPDEPESHNDGHLLFLNIEGTGFVEVGEYANLNQSFVYRDHNASTGVMGSQVADLDLDGFPDIFVGNGGPSSGSRNTLLLSYGLLNRVEIPEVGEVLVPWFDDASPVLDFPAPLPDDYEPHPLLEYPYRTHGSAVADLDGDGRPELLVSNGGPALFGEEGDNREPDRLFRIEQDPPQHFVTLRLRGNGTTVPLHPVGTRVHVVARAIDGSTHHRWQRVTAGTGLGGQNGPELIIGLGQADDVELIEVFWTDGRYQTNSGAEVDTIVEMTR